VPGVASSKPSEGLILVQDYPLKVRFSKGLLIDTAPAPKAINLN